MFRVPLTTNTRLRDCWIFSCRALVLGVKPASRMTLSTCSLVSGRTSGRSLMTREMVLTEQPLMRAMSLIVISRALAFGWIFGNGVGNVSSGYSMAQFAQKINRVEVIS